jgi:hypothetical protein
MIRITFTYNKPAGVPWFEEFYANDSAVMEMWDYHYTVYNSLPGAKLTISNNGPGETGTEGWAVIEYPDEETIVIANTDPKIVEFLALSRKYYTDIGGSIEVNREELD